MWWGRSSSESAPKSASSSASCSASVCRVAALGGVVIGAGLSGVVLIVPCLATTVGGGGEAGAGAGSAGSAGGAGGGGGLWCVSGSPVSVLVGAGFVVRHICSRRWNALCLWVSSIGPGLLASPILIPLR